MTRRREEPGARREDAELLATRPDRRTVVRALGGTVIGAASLTVSACAGGSSSRGSTPGSTVGSTGGATPLTDGGPSPLASGPVTPSTPRPTTSTAAPPTSLLATAGPDIVAGPRSDAVALTFHGAGDPALTRQVLRLCRTAKASVCVFAVGQWLAANPGLGREIVGAGHDLGNHTWSHLAMRSLALDVATDEVRRGAAAVAAEVGRPGLLFRPSGTPSSTPTILAAAAASGYQRCVSYDVDPADYLDPGATAVRSRTLAAVGPGSIVSLHLGHQGTVDALPGILAGLTSRGLRAVTLTHLLAAA